MISLMIRTTLSRKDILCRQIKNPNNTLNVILNPKTHSLSYVQNKLYEPSGNFYILSMKCYEGEWHSTCFNIGSISCINYIEMLCMQRTFFCEVVFKGVHCGMKVIWSWVCLQSFGFFSLFSILFDKLFILINPLIPFEETTEISGSI